MQPWPAVLLSLILVAGDAAGAAANHGQVSLSVQPAEGFAVGDLLPETYELVPGRDYEGFSTVRLDGVLLVVEPRSRTIVLIVEAEDQPSDRLIPPVVQMRDPAFEIR
ncbi:hypothetical protein [Chthonobacter albigriseus]|uniref:hypothetical protein n=1 Tax=Chthonobacter albigriseus TaxID=1683161 RepID=UPI0015EEE885|nr:hypothetical protein [Chthonobacter albigriseus]